MKWICIFLLLLFFTFFPCLENEFCLDDVSIENSCYPKNFTDCHYLFVEPVDHGSVLLYRPLAFFSFTVDFVLWGKNTIGWHITNIILAASTSMILFALFLFFVPRFYAFLAAALFSIHPGHCEAVIAIFNRSQIISTLGIYCAIFCFLQWVHFARVRWLFFSFVAVFLGCMSKESTLVTPALSLLFAFALGAKNKKNISIGIFAQALACLFYVGLRWYALQRFAFPEQDAFVKDASWVRHYFVACQVLWMYGSLLLFPISLSCDYSSFSISPFWPCLLLALLVFLSVYIFWRFQEKMPVFCLFWFICALAPVLHFFPLMVVVAERLLYPATPAATLFFSWCIFKTSRGKALLLLSTSLLAFCMVLLIHSRCADWKNNAVLWRKTLQTNPKSYRALIYLGSEAANQALLCNNKNYGLEKAVTYYFQALQCNPNKTNRILIYSNLGIVYFWLRDFQQSNDYCHQALQLNPKHRGTLLFLAEIAWKKQEWNQALHFYRQMPEKINRWDTLFEKF